MLVRSIRRRWRRVLAVAAGVLVLGLLFVPGVPATYRAQARMVLRETPFPALPAELPLSPAPWPRGTSLDLALSAPVLERAVRKDLATLYAAEPPERLAQSVERLRPALSARRERDSNTVVLESRASGPRSAARVANAVAGAFADMAAEQRRDEAERALARVDRALADRARQQAELVAILRGLAPGATDVALDPAEHAMRQRLADLERAQVADRIEVDALAVQIDVLSQRLERGEAEPPKPLRTVESDRLAAELGQARARLEELRASAPADAPDVARQAARVEQLRQDRARALVREALEARFAPVRDLIEEVRERTARREALRRLAAQREAQIADLRGSLRKALEARPERGGDPQRRQELEARLASLEESKRSLDALRGRLAAERELADRAVERIEPAAGASGSYGRLSAVLALALLLGLAAAPFADALAPILRTEYDVRRTVNLPLLGVVPRVKEEAGRLLTRADPSAPIADVYAVAAALVARRSREATVRALAVTSALPGEGKSTAACNLAVALARAGMRVLLIDADLRRPVQHALFGVPNETGLSNYLQGRADTVDGAIVLPAEDGPSLLPSGTPLENPVPFLRSDRFTALLVDLRARYDLLLVDLPPVLRAADGLVAAPAFDGTILVLAAEATRKEDATEAKRLIRAAGGKLFGCLLNRAAGPARGYYYYYSAGPAAEPAAGSPAPAGAREEA